MTTCSVIVPSGITVPFDQLNDGSGIAATLRSHNAKYHNTCRSYSSSSRVKRLHQKQETSPQSTPNKLSWTPQALSRKVIHCTICEGDDQNNLRKVATDNVDINLKGWAKSNNELQLYWED